MKHSKQVLELLSWKEDNGLTSAACKALQQPAASIAACIQQPRQNAQPRGHTFTMLTACFAMASSSPWWKWESLPTAHATFACPATGSSSVPCSAICPVRSPALLCKCSSAWQVHEQWPCKDCDAHNTQCSSVEPCGIQAGYASKPRSVHEEIIILTRFC